MKAKDLFPELNKTQPIAKPEVTVQVEKPKLSHFWGAVAATAIGFIAVPIALDAVRLLNKER